MLISHLTLGFLATLRRWLKGAGLTGLAAAALLPLWLGAGLARAEIPEGPNRPVQTGGGAALDGATGAVNRAFPRVDGAVYAVAADGARGWYIGGSFAAVGGQPRYNLAHIDARGALTPWNPNADDDVYALTVSSGIVYAGGFFTSVGGQPRNRLAALDAAGAVTAWNPDANGIVRALAVSGNTVYAGGDFTRVGGVTRNRLAALDAAGAVTAWNPNADGSVRALAVSGNTVYAGGGFTAMGGVTRHHLAALDGGGAVTAWNPDANGSVRALAVAGGIVYAGGGFTAVGGRTRHHLAALDGGGAVTAWNPDAGGAVLALAVSGGTVYAGGFFTSVGGRTRHHLAALDAGGAVTAWNPNANRIVNALAVSGGTVYVGGFFTSVGGRTHDPLPRLTPAGTLPPLETRQRRRQRPGRERRRDAGGGILTSMAGPRFGDSPWRFLALLPRAGVCGDGFRSQAGPGAPWQTLSIPCQPAPPATLQSTLGNAPAANFNAATLDGLWALFTRDAAADAYVRAGLGDPVGPGAGYWLRSFETPVNGLLAFGGAPSPAGCYVIPLVAAAFSPHEAAQPANDFMSNTFWLWNDTNSGYDRCNDVTPPA